LLTEYAEGFLVGEKRCNTKNKKSLRTVLLAFQYCPHSNRGYLCEQMDDFLECGKCFEYLDKDNVLNGKLHSLLEKFLEFIDCNYPHINVIIREENAGLYYKTSYKIWFRRIVEIIDWILMEGFNSYLRSVEDEFVEEFLYIKREYTNMSYRNNKQEAIDSYPTEFVKAEVRKLVDSLVFDSKEHPSENLFY